MNELRNASGRVSTRASLWVLCTICILTLGLGYISAALLPAAAPPVELTQDLAAIAPAPAPKPVAVAGPATRTVSTNVTLAPATTAPARAEKADAPVLLAQATPARSVDAGVVVAPSKEQIESRQADAEQPFVKGIPFSEPDTLEILNAPAIGQGKPVQISAPISVNAIDAAPANDDCANAITLVQGTSCTNTAGTNVEATQSVAPITCGGFTSSSALDVWYKFVATTTNPTVQVVGGGTLDSILDVRSGACNGTNIGCSDATTGGGTESVSLSGLTVGNTYLFRVYGWAGGTGTFNTCVFGTPAPANDTCTSPTPLTLNVPSAGTNSGAINDYSLAGTLATCFTSDGEITQTTSAAAGRDTVWSFTAPSAGLYSFRAQYSATTGGGNLVLYTSTTCPSPGAITCSANQKAANRNTSTTQYAGAEEVMCKSMAAGETRYLFVDEAAAVTTGGPYTVEVNPCTLDPDAGNAPATATVLNGSATCGIEGTIASGTAPRDQDFFSLGAPASGSRVFSIVDSVAATSTDVDMRVTNATDTLEYDDADNTTPWGSLGPNIGGRALAGVNSYLEVTHFTSGTSAQPYRLYSVVQPPGAGLGGSSATAEVEPNGTTLASANSAANNFFSGVISPGGTTGDLDLFAFGANAGDLIQLNIDGDPLRNSTPTAFAIFLFDAAGNQLVGFTNGTSTSSNTASPANLLGTTPNSPGEAATWRARYSGTYYAGINTQSAATTGDYLYSIGINCLTGTQLTSDVSITKSGPPTGTAGSNLVYTINVNNAGPNAANGVTWTDTFPAGATFVALSGPSGWSCSLVAGGLSCTDGGLGANVPQVFTLTLGIPQCYGNGTATNTASITSLTADTNSGNNSASVDTSISDPGTCTDGNPCTIDVCSGGFCVSSNLCEDNNACTTDVCDGQGGCANNPITCNDNNPCTDDSCDPASGCVFAPNTAACTDNNPCTIGDVCSGGSCVPGSAPLPPPVQFCNAAATLIPAGQPTTTSGIASPYPSAISVTGQPSYLCSMTVNLNNITHTFIADIDLLLARTSGSNAVIMSDVGGSTGVTGVSLTLDDAAANSLPATTVTSGTYKPTDITPGDAFASPAPAPTGGSALSVFKGGDPNGVWNLWAVDDGSGDVGSIGSWCVNVVAICQANADCDDANSCTDDTCSSGICAHAPNSGSSCSDNNACTSGDTCVNGTCTGTPTACDDSDACTTDACDPATGNCVYTPVVCNDNNTCTDDACVSPTGCTYTPNDANSCTDHDACTQTDACVGGTCVGSNPVNCDDGNVCTTDACTPSTGACTHTPNTNACDDGNACTSPDVCGPNTTTIASEAFDGATAPALPSGWTSTQTGSGSLWVTSTATPDTAPNSALGADGTTVSDELLVSPVINITSASAKLSFRSRWTFENGSGNCYDAGVLEISINGGAFTDIVTAGGSFASGGYTGTVSSSFSNPLAGRSAWCAVSTGYPNYLTVNVNLPAAANGQPIQLRWRIGTDTSTGAAGQNVDTVSVTETFQVCSGSTVSCDDNDACTTDTCDPENGCQHAPIVCNDDNVCTTDTCDSATGCVYTPISCDDGNACTLDACDPLNGCSHAPITCNDNDACTTDTCDPADGCHYVPVSCDDNNPCTDDSCDPADGCHHADNTAPCNDNDACTDNDACSGGSCVGGPAVVCNDNNACTTDSCVPASGCVYAPNTDPCDDGNACTTGDVCGDGTCHAGAPTECDDGNACTADGCNPATGCTHDPVICDDGNACTTDTCVAGVGCVFTPITCDDGNVCTDDACNPATGCVSTNNTAPCDDGNACTTGDTCSGGSCQPGGPVTIPEVTNVVIGPGSVISWDPVPGAVYDVAAGTTNDLQINGVVNATCLANDVSIPTYTDPTIPSAADGFFYLIRAQTACGNGGYGFDSGGAPRTPTSACP